MTEQAVNLAPVLLDRPAAAKALSVCEDTVLKWERKGLLPRIAFGKRGVLYDPKDFPALIEKLKAGADDERGNKNPLDTGAVST